jgi:hypothetical protein
MVSVILLDVAVRSRCGRESRRTVNSTTYRNASPGPCTRSVTSLKTDSSRRTSRSPGVDPTVNADYINTFLAVGSDLFERGTIDTIELFASTIVNNLPRYRLVTSFSDSGS